MPPRKKKQVTGNTHINQPAKALERKRKVESNNQATASSAYILDYLMLPVDFPYVYYYTLIRKQGDQDPKFNTVLLYLIVAFIFINKLVTISYPLRVPVFLGIYLLVRFYRKNSVRNLAIKYDGYNLWVTLFLKIYAALIVLIPLILIIKDRGITLE